MKTIRRAISVLLVLAILICIPVICFAAYGKKATAHYGILSGRITQSGTALTTTTKVTENQYNGYLATTIELTDGLDTKISTSRYRSSYGALELTNTTYMVGITRAGIVPAYAAYGVEVRGGSQVGDSFTIDFDVDSSVF